MSIEKKNTTTFVDAYSREIEIDKSLFSLANKEKKIHDVKFNSKATTFFKDSMKRFVKSKSALVGGIIVGILILFSIIVPFCFGNEGVYDTSVSGGGDLTEANLSPKLFDAGVGFWDGTVKKERIIYDESTKLPVGYKENTVSNLVTYEEVVDNVSSEYGSGGYANIFQNSSINATSFSSSFFNIDKSSSLSLKYNLNENTYGNYVFEGYNLRIYNGSNSIYLLGSENSYVKDYSYEVDLIDSINNSSYSLDDFSRIEIVFTLKNNEDLTSSISFANLSLSSDSSDEDYKSNLKEISFNDGNELLLKDSSSIGYWASSGGKSAYGVKFTYCNFTFDQYENAYGKSTRSKGWREILVDGGISVNLSSSSYEATTDKEVLKERFKITGDTSIYEIVEQVGDASYNSTFKRWEGYSLTVNVLLYKELGYSSMPRFIFGTNSNSQDYFKLIFTGLRFSFLLAIGVSFVNILIGLVWGSISGYFGGWTDIIMERICDILAALPSTVIITLCILYGNEFNWGSASDVIALMIALFMTGWMGVSARTRTQFYRYKGREYVLASRTLGAKDSRLIFKHILPNSLGTIITGSILMIPSVIYTEASIAYLGLGLQNQTLFGVILANANTYYRGEKAFLLYIPTFIMMLLLISFNMFGNGLRDAFNPLLKGSD